VPGGGGDREQGREKGTRRLRSGKGERMRVLEREGEADSLREGGWESVQASAYGSCSLLARTARGLPNRSQNKNTNGLSASSHAARASDWHLCHKLRELLPARTN